MAPIKCESPTEIGRYPRRLAALVLAVLCMTALALFLSKESGGADIEALPLRPTDSCGGELCDAGLVVPNSHSLARWERVESDGDLRVFLREVKAAGREDEDDLRHLALHSKDPLVAGNAIRALGRLGLVAGDEEWTALLDDPRMRVRQEIVRALGQSKDPRVAAVLHRMSNGNDPTLRTIAIHSLAQLAIAR